MSATLGDRLRIAITTSGRSQAALAQHCDVTPQAVGRWIRNSQISSKNVTSAAQFLGVSAEWLVSGRGTPGSTKDPGPPVLTSEQATLYCNEKALTPSTSRTPERPDFYLEISDESLTGPSPFSLPRGALLAMKKTDTATAGQIVLASIGTDQAPTIKQLIHDAGADYLTAINPAYPTRKLEPDDKILAVAQRAEIDLP